MPISRKINTSFNVFCLSMSSFLFLHCAGQQDGEEELENTNQQGDLGQDDAAEGNGQENFVEEDGESQEKETGEGANNALAGEGEGAPANGELPPNTTNPPLANEPLPEQTPPLPTNLPPENPAPPVQEAPAAPVASAPAPSDPNTSPVTGGRVRYAKSGGTQVVDAPGGSPVATLEQGDHPVTWEENGWFKLGTGLYVSSDALSTNGVPRPNTGAPWN